MPEPFPLQQPDDPSPRVLRDTHRPVDIDAIEARLRETRHYRIGPSPLVADLRDLIADIRAEPGSHIVVGLLGLMVGCLGTVGLAWAYMATVAF